MELVKTAVADDHPVVIEGIKQMLNGCPGLDFALAFTTDSGADLVRTVEAAGFDLVILDLDLSDIDGLEAIKAIRKLGEKMAILVYSRFHDPRLVNRVMRAGATGFLLKQDGKKEFFEALQEVLVEGVHYLSPNLPKAKSGSRMLKRGKNILVEEFIVEKYRLTKRETQVLQLISQAMSNKEIAQELFISDQTVGVHRKNIMRKLGVSNTAGLIKVAYEHQLI